MGLIGFILIFSPSQIAFKNQRIEKKIYSKRSVSAGIKCEALPGGRFSRLPPKPGTRLITGLGLIFSNSGKSLRSGKKIDNPR